MTLLFLPGCFYHPCFIATAYRNFKDASGKASNHAILTARKGIWVEMGTSPASAPLYVGTYFSKKILPSKIKIERVYSNTLSTSTSL